MDLIAKYYTKGILIDTNILLLYLVGAVNRARITKFKRTAQFIGEDYNLLIKLVGKFIKVVVTPNILTEVNSLANQLGELEIARGLSMFSIITANITEEYINSNVVAQHEMFARFGLTDCGIILLAENKYLVLTDDLKLHLYLKSLGIDTVNFNNLRNL